MVSDEVCSECFLDGGLFTYFSNDSFQNRKERERESIRESLTYCLGAVYWGINMQLPVESSSFCPEKSFACPSEHFDLLLTVFLARCLSYVLPLWILKVLFTFHSQLPVHMNMFLDPKLNCWRKRFQAFTVPCVLLSPTLKFALRCENIQF